MQALILNCTLKPSPAESNTDALARVVGAALERAGVSTDHIRIVDHDVWSPATRTAHTTSSRSSRRA